MKQAYIWSNINWALIYLSGKEGSTEATSSLVMPWWHNLMSLWNRMMHKSSKDTKQMVNKNNLSKPS